MREDERDSFDGLIERQRKRKLFVGANYFSVRRSELVRKNFCFGGLHGTLLIVL